MAVEQNHKAAEVNYYVRGLNYQARGQNYGAAEVNYLARGRNYAAAEGTHTGAERNQMPGQYDDYTQNQAFVLTHCIKFLPTKPMSKWSVQARGCTKT